MDRRACWLVLFVIFLPLRSGGVDSLTVQESDDLLEPGFWITLEDTIERAASQDSAVASERSNWRADDARIEELGLRGGWEMEITARAENVGGDRRETRNTSLGRSFRDSSGSLDEDEKYLELALVKEFWDEPRKKRDDVLEERIAQLDRVDPWMTALNSAAQAASNAYLDVYYGRFLEDVIRKQSEYQREILRVFKAQQAQGEALEVDILETELALAELDKRLISIRTKKERQLEVLRQYWKTSDLTEEELAPPEIVAASDILDASLDELLAEASTHRTDLRAAELALTTHFVGREFTATRPQLELEIAGRMGEMDRDWTDEGREDSTYEARAQLRLRYPLSQRSRNAAKLKRHAYMSEAMNSQLEALRERVRRRVTQAYDAWCLTREDLKVQRIETEKAKEQERLTRLKAETMPEILGANPELTIRSAEIRVLSAQVKYLEAEKDQMQDQVELLAEMGMLTRCPAPLSRVGP